MSEIKTLEEYVLNQIEEKDNKIVELTSTIDGLKKEIAERDSKLKLLDEVQEFVHKHVKVVTRSAFDSEYVKERITMTVDRELVSNYDTPQEFARYKKLRDFALKLGAKIEESHELVNVEEDE